VASISAVQSGSSCLAVPGIFARRLSESPFPRKYDSKSSYSCSHHYCRDVREMVGFLRLTCNGHKSTGDAQGNETKQVSLLPEGKRTKRKINSAIYKFGIVGAGQA